MVQEVAISEELEAPREAPVKIADSIVLMVCITGAIVTGYILVEGDATMAVAQTVTGS